MGELPAVRAADDANDSLKSYPTQNNDDFGLDDCDLALEEGLAIVQFLAGRLVAWRSATSRGGDVHVMESQPVASRGRVGLVRKPRAIEGGIEKIARRVARELTSRAVRSVRAGGQSHHEDAGVRIAEARDGFAPVFVIAVGFAFFARDLFSPRDEAGAFYASDYFGVERF